MGLPSTLDEGPRKSKPLFERTGAKYQVDQTQSTRLRYQSLPKNKGKPLHERELDTQPIVLSTYADVRAFLLSDNESKEDILGDGRQASVISCSTEASYTNSSSDNILKRYDNTFPLTKRQLVKYLRKVSNVLFTRIAKNNWEKHEEDAVNYANLKASIDDYYDENITHRDQTNKLVEAFMSSLDKSINTISDLYKGLNIITELLKEIKNAVKDDFAHALKQDEELAIWAKSFTIMAWNLGSRLSGLERDQNHIQSSMSFLKEDIHSIKNMMSEMYEVSKGLSSSSVTPTLALTHILAIVEGENATNAATEEPSSHIERETREPKRAIPISTIQPTKFPQNQAQPITTITTRPESSQVYHLTAEQLQAQSDKEELIKKAKEEAIILAISKLKVIKVVQEEAKKIGLNPKKIPSAKAASSKSSSRKRKHMELEPEIEIPRFECNRALLENVPFVNNIVIEEPEHMIFFTDEFGDQAFQR
nr:hypothetical protein [Tanacetum cinerariifolium]